MTRPVDPYSIPTAKAALHTLDNIARTWQLKDAQVAILLGVETATLLRWREGDMPEPSSELLARISLIFGIYRLLKSFFGTDDRVSRWLHAANKAAILNGSSALDRMLRGSTGDLLAIRDYLDSELT